MGKYLIVLFFLVFAGAASAADSGTIVGNASLHEQPEGAVSGTLMANTLVEIQERRGGWYKVSVTGGRQGWVRLGSVRLSAQGKESESVLSGLWGWLNSGRSVQSGGTATAGIRGLDAGDIEAAAPDTAAVDRLDKFAVDEATARRYAQALPLRTREVKALRQGGK